ncbi:MAG: hypothetical protein A2W90_07565 [Bacteroidetes bacterium GWF2_42_66]|nr:MAG: hypothetical protein A2W92_07555 [Bacteroidetes bacterium GWA2_42_15]OFX96943.1 MAG: hypothetical protein A2W89_20265 [Bacteroidetes bacterium GWE2_42_39]OFY44700.1 MAG: hypothetical protein A2W90_07565 [Bacteroidetes bacterium GWF2_42_66]HBL75008.1 hypothetical protein [Prolixibacteraceae bacterium]HCU60319.1 hypothetical protein [Prolixibacteraceae bacterium]
MKRITGERTENAQPFQAINRNLSSRIKTIAKINWSNAEAWNETGAIMKSPDLSIIKTDPLFEDWIFVGWLTKLHTGETTVTGRVVGANGKGSGGLKVN